MSEDKDYFQGLIVDDDASGAVWKLATILAVFLAIGMVTAVWAQGTASATDVNGKLTLHRKPCQLGGWSKEWKAADWLWRGKPHDACWRMQRSDGGDGVVVVIDSAGVMSTIPPGAFVEDRPI